VFRVANRDKIKRDFKIHGKATPLIRPGKTATLRVVFSKKGRYAYVCIVPGHAAADRRGCPRRRQPASDHRDNEHDDRYAHKPRAGRDCAGVGVRVRIHVVATGRALRQRHLRDERTGTVEHNFDVQGVKAGPFLNPGRSATMVVNLQAGRKYTYLCDVPGHAAAGMIGSFTPSP
jgi:uncharacterized cupredoxin-like copper-binding protein